MAQTEREFIHQRQAEGIAAAKARGVKFGRPRKALPEGFGEVKARWERGELSARAAGKLLGVTHRSFCLLYTSHTDTAVKAADHIGIHFSCSSTPFK